MVSLMDCVAHLLHRKILAAAEIVQTAYRRVPIVGTEEKGGDGPSDRFAADSMRRVPSLLRQRAEDILFPADHDEVHRIALFCAGAVGGAARKRLDDPMKSG